ncbi:hypothetical protein [Flavobacterium beibuense]|uniref:Uncharacterized protein n=1 Tax=Flavobacterium beibuense TaxID=657326 RepID=A0A444W977_9FLAO|nr:hypothetical protein [Flavobacterium beibuense]RYJ42440.1 hypothetical protein NU09_2226 [Flavobacterium beibuense]
MKKTYDEEAKKLANAIDIALDAFEQYPVKGLTPDQRNMMINSYLEFRHSALNPLPQYKKLASLKYLITDVFIYFNEATGDTVEYFWKQIHLNNLDYQRENKLLKILKRQKIKDRIEYEYVTDIMVHYHQQGLISDEELLQIQKMIEAFENKRIV